jgi:hypothetical protein
MAIEITDLVRQFSHDTHRALPADFVKKHRKIVAGYTGVKVPQNLSLRPVTAAELMIHAAQQPNWLPTDKAARIAMQNVLVHWQILSTIDAQYAAQLRPRYVLYALYLAKTKEIIYCQSCAYSTLQPDLLAAMVMASLPSPRLPASPNIDSALADWAMRLGQVSLVQNAILPPKPSLPHSKNHWQQLQALPATHGLSYVQAQIKQQRSFTQMLKKPPTHTQQVLYPTQKWKAQATLPLSQQEAILLKSLNAEKIYSTHLGAFFTRLLLAEADNGEEWIDKAWDGDYLILAETASQSPLIWETRWRTEKAAQQFLARYRRFTEKRLGTTLFDGKALGFDYLYPQDDPRYFLRLNKNRVLVIENRKHHDQI